jgi:hypothetical protein
MHSTTTTTTKPIIVFDYLIFIFILNKINFSKFIFYFITIKKKNLKFKL